MIIVIIYISTIAKGIKTNLFVGNKYQSANIEIVRTSEWNIPTQWSIIQLSGSHIKPVSIPTVNGSEV